jgi:hypothetical protein
MTTYSARDLANYTSEEMWGLPKHQVMDIEFDDGILTTSTERTVISWYYWAIHRNWPNTPLLKTHHVQDKDFSNKVHQGIIEEVYKDWYYTHNPLYPELHSPAKNDKEKAWRVMYDDIHNAMYNAVNVKCAEYVMTLSIEDYFEVMNNPAVFKANNSVVATQKSIDKTYSIITNELNTSESLKNSTLSKMVRSKVVDVKQILQNISVRGFVTEINSRIFPIPILNNFAGGLNKLYESMVESRSASKALMFAKDPLADCEYFNRKLQLVCQVLDTLAPGDCGSKVTMDWKVGVNELKSLSGVNYLDKSETGKLTLKSISPSDKHLIGTVVKIRTPWSCLHPDGQTVCETCYGQTALSLPWKTNPGHVSAITLGEIISQLVLATKHVDGSSTVDNIVIDDMYRPYIVPGADNNSILISSKLKGKKVKLSVPPSHARGLPGLSKNKGMHDDNYNIEKDSSMSSVKIIIEDELGNEEIQVPTSMGTRYGSFSKLLLQYIAINGFSLNAAGEYVIDITNWCSTESSISNAIFTLPFKHTNMIDFKKEIENFILTSTTKYGLKSYKGDTPTALKDLLGLINSRISINISHVMAISYCMSVKSERDIDYALPRGGEEYVFSTISRVMQGRSLGVMMAFERQEVSFSTPESYVCKDRLRHPADEILLG